MGSSMFEHKCFSIVSVFYLLSTMFLCQGCNRQPDYTDTIYHWITATKNKGDKIVIQYTGPFPHCVFPYKYVRNKNMKYIREAYQPDTQQIFIEGYWFEKTSESETKEQLMRVFSNEQLFQTVLIGW